jgi:hypothetical protein
VKVAKLLISLGVTLCVCVALIPAISFARLDSALPLKQAYAAASKVELPTPSGIKASRKSTTSIKVSWKIPSDATGVKVYQYSTKHKKFCKVYTTKKATSKVFKKLKKNTIYKYKVAAYKTTAGKTYTGKQSYTVSAMTCTASSKYRNATTITSPGSVTFGLRMSKVFTVRYKGFTNEYGETKYKLPGNTVLASSDKKVFKVISYAHSVTVKSKKSAATVKKGYTTKGYSVSVATIKKAKTGKASTYKITYSNKIKAIGFGTAYLTMRAHNGITRKIKVIVKNYAEPKQFWVDGFPLGIELLGENQKEQVCDIAQYFYTHPSAGSGEVAFEYSGDNKYPAQNGNYILTVSSTLKLSETIKQELYDLIYQHMVLSLGSEGQQTPLRLVIDISSSGVDFTSWYGDTAFSSHELSFWYTVDKTDDWATENGLNRVAPHWFV